MKNIIIAVIAVLILFTMFGCASSCKSKDHCTKTPIVKLDKSNCYGKCAEFELSIFENGHAKYIGKRNVDMIGAFHATVDKDELESLVNSFDSIDFNSLESAYLFGAKDLQKIKIEHNGKLVEFHKREAPQVLLDLLDSIDGLVESSTWESIE